MDVWLVIICCPASWSKRVGPGPFMCCELADATTSARSWTCPGRETVTARVTNLFTDVFIRRMELRPSVLTSLMALVVRLRTAHGGRPWWITILITEGVWLPTRADSLIL